MIQLCQHLFLVVRILHGFVLHTVLVDTFQSNHPPRVQVSRLIDVSEGASPQKMVELEILEFVGADLT